MYLSYPRVFKEDVKRDFGPKQGLGRLIFGHSDVDGIERMDETARY